MERYNLENAVLTIAIKQKGAELASIVKKETGQEYMWQADSAFWGRHSCILFPIIGKLNEGRYQVKEETFEMGQHGFVRDRLFDLTEKGADFMKFSYKSTEEDKKLYPFSFVVNIIYTLHFNTLAVTYQVENLENDTISFSLGGHPAFNCPLGEDEERSDYSLRFDVVETAKSYLLNSDGLFDGKTKEVFNDSTDLPITNNLFDEDALVFKDLQSSKVILIDKEKVPVLTFDFTGFPYLGIWSKNRQSPYVCIEPWFGIADNVGGQRDFFDKEGNQRLEAGKLFDCTHKITIH